MKLKTILEMPTFAIDNKKAVSDQGSLKNMPIESVTGNIVLFYSEKGNDFWEPGKFLAYFMDSEEAASALKSGNSNMLMFLPGTLSQRMGGYSMIDDVWKKKRQQPGTEHIVGMMDGFYRDGKLFVDNISVRPGWKRNTVAQKLVQMVKQEFQAEKIDHSETTKDGHKFFKATGDLAHNKSAAGGEHGKKEEKLKFVSKQE